MFDSFPIRYLFPNSITALSLMLGCATIVLAAQGRPEDACWLLIWCGLLDRADGVVARLVNGSSVFGGHFDTLSDMVAFCVAPGLMIFFTLSGDARYATHFEAGRGRFLLVAVTVYILAGAIRLARYNSEVSELGHTWFRGLPTTIAGLMIGSYMLSVWDSGLNDGFIYAIPFILIFLSVLMVSNFWLPKSFGKVKWVLAAQIVGAVVIYTFGFLKIYPQVLFLGSLAYPLIGFSVGWFLHRGGASEKT